MEALTVISDALKFFAPPPPKTLSQWADEYRHVASGPYPGKWHTSRTPDLKEIMDCVTDPDVETLVIIKPTRAGATEGIINNAIGYAIHYDPCQILYVQTSLEEGRKYSVEILGPMIESTAVLRERVSREKLKKSKQTQLHRSFPGGNLTIVGAKSPKGFRMVSKRWVICDDIDGYESNKEGDAVSLAIGRAKDFWNKKIILVSNPTTEGVSRIHSAFLESDQRYRFVPCPLCGTFQVLKFGGKDCDFGLKWDKSSVWYLCEHCHQRILEYQKSDMNDNGEWKPAGTFTGTAGFHVNPFLRAWHHWVDFKTEFLKCNKDPYKLMVFINQWLGEIWKADVGVKVDEQMVYDRREVYPAEVPVGALILTAAVDVQKSRVEIEVKGWGPDEESWGIEYKILNGAFLESSLQTALDGLLDRTWRHESGGQMRISRVAIDSGGHYTSQVYAYCKSREAQGIYAIKGANNPKADVLDGMVVRRKDAVYQMVGVSACKDILYGRLAFTAPGAGYMHFPMSYDREYFRQLFSERSVVTRGMKREWRVLPGRSNEAVDINNYNLAALRMYAPDWDELKKRSVADCDNIRRVYRTHNVSVNMTDGISINRTRPLILCCDFGKNPLIWVICQQEDGVVYAHDEFYARNVGVMDMCLDVLRKYGDHAPGFIVYGSAIGSVKSFGQSDYMVMRNYGFGRQSVKSMNPAESDRINAVNNMLCNIAGESRLKYHSRCVNLDKDFKRLVYLEDMSGIDRTEFGRGSASDALGYYIHQVFPFKTFKAAIKKAFWK